MGTVFKKQTTRPLPAGAEIFVRKGERCARWKDRKGKTRTSPVTTGKDGAARIATESPYFVAKYRDGAGSVQTVSTGCRDETAARQVLADLERRAELIRSGVMTGAEAAIGDHQGTPIGDHLTAYLTSLEAKGACEEHRSERQRQLRRLAADCSFGSLSDLCREAIESWLNAQARAGMGARTRNSYLASLLAFCNWCIETNRLTSNPFVAVPKANEKADPRRQRRAMVEPELVKLLAVARERPLLEALTVRKGPRKGERYADVRPEVRERLDLLGREWALIYKTLVLTGLRKGELASLTVAHLRLDGGAACLTLDAADEKNREGSEIALRDDLATDLREWLADKLQRLQSEARGNGATIPARLPPDTPVFCVPDKLSKILNRDLRFAGIPKRDDRGRTLDVHALRHTFGTLMSKGGVSPRTAQAAMRHSRIDLTMNVYTDPRLLDVRGALDVLPTLSLDAGQQGRETIRVTGTDATPPAHRVQLVAPTVAPTICNRGQFGAPAVNMARVDGSTEKKSRLAVSGFPVNTKGPLTIPVNSPLEVGATGLEPVTPSVSSGRCRMALSVANTVFHRHFTRLFTPVNPRQTPTMQPKSTQKNEVIPHSAVGMR